MAGLRSTWHLIESDFHANQRTVVESIAGKRGGLREGLDVARATDRLWTLNHPENWRMLVDVRRWSPADYEAWLAESSCAQLLPALDERRRRGVSSGRR